MFLFKIKTVYIICPLRYWYKGVAAILVFAND